jgi:site-specific DNA recombinase
MCCRPGSENVAHASFTTKRGRRYRYYVSQSVIKNPASRGDGSTRVPAPALEERVIEKVLAFLRSDADVFDRLSADRESPAISKKLASAAKALAACLPSLSSDGLRDRLVFFLRRVVIRDNSIEVMISSRDLRQLLQNGDKAIAVNSLGAWKPFGGNDLISLIVEAKRKKRGGEVHLVVPPNFSNPSPRHPKESLIKAVARAHSWYEKVIQGQVSDMRSLAQLAGLTERYVGKVFACAFLAPDIIESILEGRQPHDLNFEKLCRHVPLSWVEQRAQFGFSPCSTGHRDGSVQ